MIETGSEFIDAADGGSQGWTGDWDDHHRSERVADQIRAELARMITAEVRDPESASSR